MNAAVSTEVRPEVSISTWNIDPVHSTARFKVKHMMMPSSSPVWPLNAATW
jgi:polyisoprenoid-binding protein YceI